MVARARKRSRKWIGWVVFLVLLVVAGVACYLVWDNYFKDGGAEVDEPESSEVEITESGTADDEEYGSDEATLIENGGVEQYDGQYSGGVSEAGLTGVITYAGISGDYLMVRVNIDQYLSEGSCELVLSRGGEVEYKDTAAIVNSAASSTCEGFNVPAGKLAGTNYGIVVNLSSDGQTGAIIGEVSL